MGEKFPISFWNYNRNHGGAFTGPEEVEKWHRLGITMPMTPCFTPGKDDEKEYFATLDEIGKYGMKAMIELGGGLLYGGGDEEEYEKNVKKLLDTYASHPAVGGLFFGDEPGGDMKELRISMRIVRKLRPDLMQFLCLGAADRMERDVLYGNQTVTDWMKQVVADTGTKELGFSCYELMYLCDEGADQFFYNLNTYTTAAEAAGIDMWVTLLASAHYWFAVPTENDFRRQINVSVASGIRGISWFSLYTKYYNRDYRELPFDEYGEETPTFGRLKRSQKHFNDQYGELFLRLRHEKTFHLLRSFGGYPLFDDEKEDSCWRSMIRAVEYIVEPYDKKMIQPCEGLIGFFSDPESKWKYAAIVNNSHDRTAAYNIVFSEKVSAVERVHRCGEDLLPIGTDPYELWLSAGEMEVIRFK